MIRAELRDLDATGEPHVPDMDLEHYAPEDPEDVALAVTASIGPRGEPGEELFEFLVRTPRALTREIAESHLGYLVARHYIIVPTYDYDLVRRAIIDLCDRAQGPDWETVATWLARYGQWEFEDYQECPPGIPD